MWDEVLSSWVSFQCLRYFSFKILYEEKIDKNKPYILGILHYYIYIYIYISLANLSTK